MVGITVSRAMRMVAVNRLITLLMVGMFIGFAASRYFLIPLLASLIIAVFLRSMLRCPNCGRNVYLKRMKASGTMPERDYNSGSMVDERMASRAVPDCYRADRSHHREHVYRPAQRQASLDSCFSLWECTSYRPGEVMLAP